MNWILLIIGGLFEVGFASCLGKANETKGILDVGFCSLPNYKHVVAV